MTLLVVLATLLLQHYREFPARAEVLSWLARSADRVREMLDGGEVRHGAIAWCIVVVPVVMIAIALDRLFASRVSGILSWALSFAVLYVFLEFKPLVGRLEQLRLELHHGRLDETRALLTEWGGQPDTGADASELCRIAIEQGLLRFHRNVSALLFWLALMPGASGVLLYVASRVLWSRWSTAAPRSTSEAFSVFAQRAFGVIDWVPVRLTAFAFAVVGNFEDAIYCWRGQARAWGDPHAGAILASGAGALGIRLGDGVHTSGSLQYRPELGVDEAADPDHLQSLEGLLWRAGVLWIAILALLTVGAWAGD